VWDGTDQVATSDESKQQEQDAAGRRQEEEGARGSIDRAEGEVETTIGPRDDRVA
jgi:hypothetical protein